MIAESPFTAVLGAMSSDTRTDDSLIHAARALITSGMAVVVCRPDTKFPMCTLTAKEIRDADTLARMEALENDDPRAESARHRCGLHHSLTDTKTSDRVLKRLIASHGRVNLGIDVSRSTQTASWSPGTLPETRRLLVVDVDTEDQLRHFRDAWENVTKEPFPTMTISSPGVCDTEGAWVHKGGGHFYFSIPPKYNAALDADTFSGALTSETGWSAMWSGRQILVPPSSRPEGRYVLTGSVHELPEWLGHRVVQHIVTRRRRAQEQETRRLERVASGTESNVDAWSRAVSWDELLEPLEWVKTGSVTTCGCPEWTAPGWHANPKSATAHEPGCSDPRIDTSMGYGPLHLWTDNPPEELRDLPGSSSGKTCSKIMFMALMYYRGSIAVACRGLGIAREDGPGLLRPLQGVTLSPEQGMGEGHEGPGSIPPPSYSATPKPESEVVEDEEYLKLLARHRAQQRLEQTHADELETLEQVRQLRRIRAADAAKAARAQENLNLAGPGPQFETGTEFLAGADDDGETWILDQVWPTDGNVMLSAQRKSGKTTLIGNLTRVLCDGGSFLGRYPVTWRPQKIAIIDLEMSRSKLRVWTREQQIENTDRFAVINLRGEVARFDIFDERVRGEWAERLRSMGVDLVILDCLRPLMDAFGMDENHDIGKVTVAFDALKAAAGIGPGMIVHHSGHDGERSRGDSRARDWPDAEWFLARENDRDSSPRTFRAYGRDVNVDAETLSYDSGTRRLLLPAGDAKLGYKDDPLRAPVLAAVVALLRETAQPLTGRAIKEGLTGKPFGKNRIDEVLARHAGDGLELRREAGSRNAILYAINEGPHNPFSAPRAETDLGTFTAPPEVG